jgi:hypothetical protein
MVKENLNILGMGEISYIINIREGAISVKRKE